MYKKIFVFMFVLIILLSFTSAATIKDFVKDEEKSTSLTNYGTITLKDRSWIDVFGWFEETKQELTLVENTEQCEGNICYAIMNTKLYDSGVLVTNEKFYDTGNKNKWKELNDVKYKYFLGELKTKEVDDYEWKCNIKTNKNSSQEQSCGYEVVGKHIEEYYEWTPYNKEIVEAGEYILKLEAEVGTTGTYEWVITSQGKDIEEWAGWTTSLRSGLVSYYSYDLGGGNKALDLISGKNDLDLDNNDRRTGISGLANYHTASSTERDVNTTPTGLGSGATAIAVSFWVNRTGAGLGMMGVGEGGENTYFFIDDNIGSFGGPANDLAWSGVTQNVWTHIVYMTDAAGNFSIWKNGVLDAQMDSGAPNFNFNKIQIGFTPGTGIYQDGMIDEIGIWNRTLTTSEISDLYNSGNGLPLTNNIFVTLVNPADDFSTDSKNITFNVSITSGIELANVSLFLDGVRNDTNSISGLSVDEGWLKELSIGQHIWTAEVCATNNTCVFADDNFTLNIGASINSNTFNSSTYETASESFILDVNSSIIITSTILYYNSTSSDAMTNQGGGVWSLTKDITTNVLGNNSFYYRFVYSTGETSNSTTYYQYVSPLNFSQCGVTDTGRVLNISFQDETTSANINASIDSTFTYYLGSGSVNKTYTLVNATDNFNYLFNTSVTDRNVKVIPYVQYRQLPSYPQRIWNPSEQIYSTDTTNQTLFLLGSSYGIYVTFQVLTPAGSNIEGVFVNVERNQAGVYSNLTSGTTGADGAVTFWLNPDYQHRFTFSKTGYDSVTQTIVPTQSTYTVYMGDEATEDLYDFGRGIDYTILPSGTNLSNGTSHTFSFTLSSNYWTVSEFGFVLKDREGNVIDTKSASTNGGTVSSTKNTGTNSTIKMEYYYVITGNYTNLTKTWMVDAIDYDVGLNRFFKDLVTFSEDGIFGLNQWSLVFIIFLIIFVLVGLMSYSFGVYDPIGIATMLFGLVFFFDVILGLIPSPDGAIEHLATIITGFIMFIVVIIKVQRG